MPKPRLKVVKSKPLPFPPLKYVKDIPGGFYPRDFWAIKPTGNYVADCRTGSEHALACIDMLCQGKGGWAILQSTVNEMVRKGDNNGVVVGFMGVISRALAGALFAVPEISAVMSEDEKRAGQCYASVPGGDDGHFALKLVK